MHEPFTYNTKINLGADTFATYDGNMWEVSDTADTVLLTRGEMERLVELAGSKWTPAPTYLTIIETHLGSVRSVALVDELEAAGYKIMEVGR